MKTYSKQAIDSYALYNVVRLVDTNDEIYTGWLVPSRLDNEYMLLPISDIWHTYTFKRSYIKSIQHITNGKLITKGVKR